MGSISSLPAARIAPPTRLTAEHDVDGFDSTEPQLNHWLRRRGLKNEGRFLRTYVACSGNRVIGFYCLANGAVYHDEATGKLKRNAPNPIPVMTLGRLAVDREWEGRGLGSDLLRDAILRVMNAAEVAGIAAILVHAMSEKAKAFYRRFDFEASELNPMTLMLRLEDVVRSA